ncbi:hypothetical protein [Chitinimonas koreensis]|uniref:hypothetical protein n=1 Tax=Chitinimonas koreensis TaxID=356302 RepID=UPI0003F9EC47|nr:hypothetical protein [Chitinimonas koreensis]QNM97627.1 hypothetical protein H9L41_04825 [Chitinimonas koreensis]
MSTLDLNALERLVDAAARLRGAYLQVDGVRSLKLAPHGDGWLFALEVANGAANAGQVAELLTRRWLMPREYDALLLGASPNDALMLVQRMPRGPLDAAGLADAYGAMTRLLGG